MCGFCEDTNIIGTFCTPIEPYKGYTEGTVIGEYGIELLVRVSNGKGLTVYRDGLLSDD